MHPVDIERSLETMTICVDTREQPTQRAETRYKQFGVPYIRKKLDVGDYSAIFDLPDGSQLSLADKAVVERKQNLTEVCMCYCRERSRFTREFERAKKANIRVYLLVEDARWDKVYSGKYRSQMSPKSLVASLLAWMARYDCKLIMCDETISGKLIHDILYYEGREMLMRMVDE